MSGLIVFLIILAFVLVGAFEIWMFVHAILNKHLETVHKLLWLVLMLLIHPFAAIVYYFMEYKKQV